MRRKDIESKEPKSNKDNYKGPNTMKDGDKKMKADNNATQGGNNNLIVPDTYVKKWVDYSSKYGLGYLLSNGLIGVFFNDSSKIILDTKSNSFNYIERKSFHEPIIVSSHSLTKFPKELQSKVTLLQHFKSYLDIDNNTNSAQESEMPLNYNLPTSVIAMPNSNDADLSKDGDKKNMVYIQRWIKTSYSIMFRLSNKIAQVCFQDHTEIILSSESRVVTYANKRGERTTYPLSIALESSNREMTKRLKHTKDILTHFISFNQQANQNQQQHMNEDNDPTSADHK